MKLRVFTLVAAFLAAAFAVSIHAQTVYSSLDTTGSFNVRSQCFECDRVSEFGDEVTLAPGARLPTTVTVTMSSWACQSFAGGICTTTPGATFSVPITLTLYAVNTAAPTLPGPIIAQVTQTFSIPYRPSTSPACGDSRWMATDGLCYNGIATNIVFDLQPLGITLPNTFIWSVSYNTQTSGPNPTGVPGPADLLNVGLSAGATIGTDVDPNGVFVNAADSAFYCDGGTAGTFRSDTGCWGGSVQTIAIAVTNVPTSAAQCQNGGWQTLARPDGTTFANQGQCVSFVNSGKSSKGGVRLK